MGGVRVPQRLPFLFSSQRMERAPSKKTTHHRKKKTHTAREKRIKRIAHARFALHIDQMQVILRHAKQEYEVGRNCTSPSHSAASTDAAHTHLESLSCAPVPRPAATTAAPRHSPRPLAHTTPTPTTTSMQFTRQPGADAPSPSPSALQHSIGSFSAYGQDAHGGSLTTPPTPRPFSFLSDTSMTASLSLDDLAAREQERAVQRRRRGDVDRVLQIFDEVDAHFASLETMTKQRTLTSTTTTTSSSCSGPSMSQRDQ